MIERMRYLVQLVWVCSPGMLGLRHGSGCLCNHTVLRIRSKRFRIPIDRNHLTAELIGIVSHDITVSDISAEYISSTKIILSIAQTLLKSFSNVLFHQYYHLQRGKNAAGAEISTPSLNGAL